MTYKRQVKSGTESLSSRLRIDGTGNGCGLIPSPDYKFWNETTVSLQLIDVGDKVELLSFALRGLAMLSRSNGTLSDLWPLSRGSFTLHCLQTVVTKMGCVEAQHIAN